MIVPPTVYMGAALLLVPISDDGGVTVDDDCVSSDDEARPREDDAGSFEVAADVDDDARDDPDQSDTPFPLVPLTVPEEPPDDDELSDVVAGPHPIAARTPTAANR